MGFQMSEIEFETQIFLFFDYDASPNLRNSLVNCYPSTFDIQIKLSKWHLYKQNLSLRYLFYLNNHSELFWTPKFFWTNKSY